MRQRGMAWVDFIGHARASGKAFRGLLPSHPTGRQRPDGRVLSIENRHAGRRTGSAVQASLRARSSESRVHVQSIAGFVPPPR